jgi:hypothetical protein
MTSGCPAVDDDALAMRKGESPGAYLARLESVDRATLDEDSQLALVISLAMARKKLNRADKPGRTGLDRCKEAVRKLPVGERKQLARWIAEGMHD